MKKRAGPTLGLRLSKNELTVLTAYAAATGLTRSRIIHQFIRDQMSLMAGVIVNEMRAKAEDAHDPGNWTKSIAECDAEQPPETPEAGA